MNKASRRSGGAAVKKVPENLARTFELINLVRTVPCRKEIPYIRTGNFTPIGPNDVKICYEYLNNVLRMCPVELAIDVLTVNQTLKDVPRESLIEILNDPQNEIFEQNEDATGAIAAQKSLDRLQVIYDAYQILELLIKNFQKKKDKIDTFLKDNPQMPSAVVLSLNQMIPIQSFSILYNRKGHAEFLLHPLLEQITSIEISRVLICPGCSDFYWVKRKNMSGCANCLASLRNKKWRYKISEENKALYNKARRKKRQKNKPNSDND